MSGCLGGVAVWKGRTAGSHLKSLSFRKYLVMRNEDCLCEDHDVVRVCVLFGDGVERNFDKSDDLTRLLYSSAQT